MNTLPDERLTWELMVEEAGIHHLTIHDLKLDSASNIKDDQFLLLRILWTMGYANGFDARRFGLDAELKMARKILDGYDSWSRYRQSFEIMGKETTAPDLGTFSLVKYYQLQVAKVEEDAESKPDVTVSPIAHRTRGKEKGGGGQLLQRLQLETPTRSTGKRQETSEGFDSTPDFEESMITVLSPVPKELESILYPPTKDEQIVNAALILFLNALTIHFPLFNDWTLHRRAFTVDFRTASFEARTDGYLQDERTGKVRALVEVKPITRKKGGKRIHMQEGAQMVAWICDDKQRPSQSPGRHLHISQDRHEVYLTFAEYDEKYLKYLKGELPLGDPPSFMTMHEFGPWNINSKSHMENLGRIVLAFTIRAHEDQKAESGSVGQGQNKKVGLLG